MKYMLERAEPYIVPTEQLKNRTHQTHRWKQVAMSDDANELRKLMGRHHRIVRQSDLRVIEQTFRG